MVQIISDGKVNITIISRYLLNLNETKLKKAISISQRSFIPLLPGVQGHIYLNKPTAASCFPELDFLGF